MSSATIIRLPRRVTGIRGVHDNDEAVQALVADIQNEPQDADVVTVEASQTDMLHSQIEHLEGELQSAREQSYNLGFKDGVSAEREKHIQALEAHAQQFRELAERLEQEFDQALTTLEEPLLRMSFRISEKILNAPLPDELRDESLTATILSFLREVLHEGSVVIHVAPASLALLQSDAVSEKFKQSFPGKLRFVADDNLRPGECQVETQEHIIDGSYANQLKILEDKLR